MMRAPWKMLKRFFCSISPSAYKSFDEIPGPKSLPFIGTSWKYLPLIGDFRIDKLHITGAKMLQQYGSLVKEEVGSGFFLIHVFEPEDIEQVYKNEGKYPARRSHLGLEFYRNSRPNLYNSGGILPVNGNEWWRLRSNFQKALSRMKDVRSFLPKADKITDEFLDKCIITNKPIEDFLSLISRLNLELTWMVMFGKRLGCFESENIHLESVPSRLIEAAETVNTSILRIDGTAELLKIIKTPTYRKLEKSLSFIESIVLAELQKKRKDVSDGVNETNSDCLIDHYLENPNVDFKDILGMSIDLVLGGVDTTSYTSSFIVYHLAKSARIQEKLKMETSSVMKDNPTVTSNVLNEATYARAVLKETFRLNPIAVGISRNLDEDTILSGYMIPKKTMIITQNMVACRQEKFFKNPTEFIPERWMKESPEYSKVSPYLILPFSHGPRTCIARRLAEQNLLTFILKIGQRYKLKWLGEELELITPLICKPSIPIKLLFTEWEKNKA